MKTTKRNVSADNRLLQTISLLVRTAPISLLAPLLLDTGIFEHISHALEDDTASGLILAAYLEILSRIAMADPNVLLRMVAESAKKVNIDGHQALEQVLDGLWRNFDYVGGARMRKAVAMGAAALLTTVCSTSRTVNHADTRFQGTTQVLERFDGEFSARTVFVALK